MKYHNFMHYFVVLACFVLGLSKCEALEESAISVANAFLKLKYGDSYSLSGQHLIEIRPKVLVFLEKNGVEQTRCLMKADLLTTSLPKEIISMNPNMVCYNSSAITILMTSGGVTIVVAFTTSDNLLFKDFNAEIDELKNYERLHERLSEGVEIMVQAPK